MKIKFQFGIEIQLGIEQSILHVRPSLFQRNLKPKN